MFQRSPWGPRPISHSNPNLRATWHSAQHSSGAHCISSSQQLLNPSASWHEDHFPVIAGALCVSPAFHGHMHHESPVIPTNRHKDSGRFKFHSRGFCGGGMNGHRSNYSWSSAPTFAALPASTCHSGQITSIYGPFVPFPSSGHWYPGPPEHASGIEWALQHFGTSVYGPLAPYPSSAHWYPGPAVEHASGIERVLENFGNYDYQKITAQVPELPRIRATSTGATVLKMNVGGDNPADAYKGLEALEPKSSARAQRNPATTGSSSLISPSSKLDVPSNVAVVRTLELSEDGSDKAAESLENSVIAAEALSVLQDFETMEVVSPAETSTPGGFYFTSDDGIHASNGTKNQLTSELTFAGTTRGINVFEESQLIKDVEVNSCEKDTEQELATAESCDCHLGRTDVLCKNELKKLWNSLRCGLCSGLLIDACSLGDCRHVFCKLCIIKHLLDCRDCPVCHIAFDVDVPSSVRDDTTLQRIIHKLFPDMVSEETARRKKYDEHPDEFSFFGHPQSGHLAAVSEDLGNPDLVEATPEFDTVKLEVEIGHTELIREDTIVAPKLKEPEKSVGATPEPVKKSIGKKKNPNWVIITTVPYTGRGCLVDPDSARARPKKQVRFDLPVPVETSFSSPVPRPAKREPKVDLSQYAGLKIRAPNKRVPTPETEETRNRKRIVLADYQERKKRKLEAALQNQTESSNSLKETVAVNDAESQERVST